jgi:acetyl esterase/lipase
MTGGEIWIARLVWRLTIFGFALSGCGLIERIAIPFLYEKTDLPESQVVRDLAYWDGPDRDVKKHRLDLFLPKGTAWPVLVFAHGGGWTEGDKGLRVGGADVYGNIGRFFAARGVGTAVINYRLLPNVTWRDQVQDVARAVAWVHSHIRKFGGDPDRLFLAGHSAGAQLVARVALDAAPLETHNRSPAIVCGVTAVSGAGLDLADAKTYELGEDPAYYEQRFRDKASYDRQWQVEASPTSFVDPNDPPFLILYAEGESKGLQRQSRRLNEVLALSGVESKVVTVSGESHSRIVLALSHPDKTAAPAILGFISNGNCAERRRRPRRDPVGVAP